MYYFKRPGMNQTPTTWNEKLSEVWSLLSQSPQSFKGGDIWSIMVSISNGLQGVGYGLLVLFFAMGVFQSAASFRELQRPEFALRHFIRFAGAKIAVGYAMDLMLAVFSICSGIAARAMSSIGGAITVVATLPSEITTAIEDLSFLESIHSILYSVAQVPGFWHSGLLLNNTSVNGRGFSLSHFSVSKNLLARERPRLPLTRELSPQATEGEKMLWFIPYNVKTHKF